MKIKTVAKVTALAIAGLITLVIVGFLGTLYFQKADLEKKEKAMLIRETETYKSEIGKKRKFLSEVFSVKNIDKADYLILENIVEKNIIVDTEGLGDLNTFEGYTRPLTSGLKKISVELVSSSEEFKLVSFRSSKIKNDTSSIFSFLKFTPANSEAILEDSKGLRYAIKSSKWALSTDSVATAFQVTKKDTREENNIFNETLTNYKKNPTTEVEIKYCGSESGQAMFEQKVHRFDVEKRMNEVLIKVFDSKNVQSRKLEESEINGVKLICYSLKFNQIQDFLKASFIFPKTIFGFWQK